MRSIAVIAALGLISLLAPTADANWDIKAKLTCYSDNEDGPKPFKEKGKNEEIIAECLNVAPSDSSVDNHSLVFDSDFRQLQVIRNCDALIVCDLSTQLTCASALDGNEADYKLQQQCIYRLIDFPVDGNDVEGTMICKEKESFKESTDKFKFKTSCRGNFDFEGDACELSFKSGKLFEESGTCPVL